MGVSYSSNTGLANWVLGNRILGPDTAKHLIGVYENSTGNFQSSFNTSFPQTCHIYSPELSGVDVQRSTNRNQVDQCPLFVIPIFAEQNGLNYYQPSVQNVVSVETTSLERFSLQFKDAQGNPIENMTTDYQLHVTFF